MSKDFRIKNMSCDGKPIPNKYISCFNGYIEDVINKAFENELVDLQHRLEVAEKALELACERVKYFEDLQDRETGFINYDLQGIIEQYKEQAKQRLVEIEGKNE